MKSVFLLRKDAAMANEALQEFENSFDQVFEGIKGLYNNTEDHIDESWETTFSLDAEQLHIESSLELAETICGRDDRVRVDPKLYPHRFICRLIITAKSGARYFGSGFFISPKCVITSGHCVHFDSLSGGSNFDWAQSIEVIPGADGPIAPFGSQMSSNFRTVRGWAVDRDSNFDYGAIILPDETLFHRIKGYFGAKELRGPELLMNVGYPGDKYGELQGTCWATSGPVAYINNFKIAYMLDTYGGNSGSPVFVRIGDHAVVVGVHGYGSCPNHCVKVQDSVLQRWNEWTQL